VKSPNGLLQYGLSVLRTTVDAATRAVIAQLGDVLSGSVDDDDAEWWQHVGFASRPADAEATKKSAQSIALRGPGYSVVVASRDLRASPGDLGAGETAVFSAGADGTIGSRVTCRADGRVEVKTDASSGASILLDPGADSITLTNAAGWGIAITKSGLTLTGPGGTKLELTSSGASLTGAGSSALSLVAAGATMAGPAGGKVALGPAGASVEGVLVRLGGPAAAVPALGGPSGIAGVPSSKVLLAP
jgi:phage gp45-like